VSDGKEVLRFPMRQNIDADSIRLDRDAPYPEGIFVDGTPDRVGATVYRAARLPQEGERIALFSAFRPGRPSDPPLAP
jgi:hypothetical protein